MFEVSSSSIEISRQLGPNSAFGRQLREKSLAQIDRILDRIGERAVQYAEDHIADTFNINRPAFRRRMPGSRRLAGSMRYRVEHPAGMIGRVELLSMADPTRVAALEFGSPAHPIVGNPLLAFPTSEPGSRRATAASIPRFRVTPAVNHPGNPPFRFMQRALDRAVNEVLATARARA